MMYLRGRLEDLCPSVRAEAVKGIASLAPLDQGLLSLGAALWLFKLSQGDSDPDNRLRAANRHSREGQRLPSGDVESFPTGLIVTLQTIGKGIKSVGLEATPVQKQTQSIPY